MVVQPTDFRDGDDVVWRLVWAVEGGSDHLHGCPASILLGEEHHGYVPYPLKEIGPLGRIHADRWRGDRSLQVPVPGMGPGVFQELPQGGTIRNAHIGRNGMAAGIRYRQGMEVRKTGHISGGGPPLRRYGGAQEFREGR